MDPYNYCGHSWETREHQPQVLERFNPFKWYLLVGKYQIFMGIKLSCNHFLPVTPKKPFSILKTDLEIGLGTKRG